MKRVSGALALCLVLATPAAARFEAPTLCEGVLNFPNGDGTSVIYDLAILLGPYGYALVSTDRENGEVTEDTGPCTDYAGSGCTHRIPPEGDFPADSYRFRIQRMNATTYAYEEVWADGAVGRTILTCTPGS